MIVFYFGNTSSVSLKLIEKILECLNRYENIIIIRDKHVGEFRKKYKGWWMDTVRSAVFQLLPLMGVVNLIQSHLFEKFFSS